MSLAIESQGTTVTWNNTPVAEVVSFNGPGGVAGTYDVTHLLSTRREKRASLADEGDFSLECNYIPSDPGQQALLADRATRTVREVIVTYSDGTTDTFDAYCTGAPKSGAVDGKIPITFTLAITGEVVNNPAESS
jgi:hypothetical protein